MKWHLSFLTTLLAVTLVLTPGLVLSASPELAAEQVFRWGHSAADMDTVDPAFSTYSAATTAGMWISNGLVRLPPGTVDFDNIEGDLAESWDISKDGLTYTLYLRKGVQWHKGYGEFNAEDVKYTLDRLRDPKVASPFGAKYLVIREVKVVDRYTVKIILKKPSPFFLMDQLLGFRGGMIVCKKQGEELGDGNFGMKTIGTGPFQVKEYLPKEKLVLVRNEKYFRGAPILERVELIFMPDAATKTLVFIKGELDAIYGQRDSKWIKDVKAKVPTAIVDAVPIGSGCAVHFNMTRKPLDDVRVRKALAYAVDREILHKYFGPIWTEMTAPVPPVYFGALAKEDTLEDLLYNYDLEKAKKLLAEAGYADGFKIKGYSTSKHDYLVVFEMLAAMWKKLGVEFEIKVVDHTTFHHNIRADMNDVVVYIGSRSPFADSYLTQWYHSASIVKKPHAVTNFSHYGDVDADGDGVIDNVDWLIEKARSETDPVRQKVLYGMTQSLILDDMPALPLHELVKVVVRHGYFDPGFEIKGMMIHGHPLDKARILKH